METRIRKNKNVSIILIGFVSSNSNDSNIKKIYGIHNIKSDLFTNVDYVKLVYIWNQHLFISTVN